MNGFSNTTIVTGCDKQSVLHILLCRKEETVLWKPRRWDDYKLQTEDQISFMYININAKEFWLMHILHSLGISCRVKPLC